MLPDDVLIEIFNCYRYSDWQTLVHVCRRWRSIVFGSPRHLNLQLFCTDTTPVRDMLDIWPALPLHILLSGYNRTGMDNIVAALECADRVGGISLLHARTQSLELEIFLAALQQPFPELTYMYLRPNDKTVPVVPDSFLGGSAPRLEYLELHGIPFPGLPKLLLSATHLVTLRLYDIPHSGYFSPDVMGVALLMLTSLEYLSLEFESPRSSPDQARQHSPPSTRSVLPVLIYFSFKGVSEYLNDLVACFDASRLNTLDITFFDDTIFDTPQLVRFISHTPIWKAFEKAYITFYYQVAVVDFSSQTSRDGELREFKVQILCEGLNRQVSSLEQVCTSCMPPLSILEDLYIDDYYSKRNESILNRRCLEILRPFMAVKNLFLSEAFASHIAPALQMLAEDGTTDVLPALQKIFLKGFDSSGSVQEGIGQFVAARQVANHPIGISPW